MMWVNGMAMHADYLINGGNRNFIMFSSFTRFERAGNVDAEFFFYN